MLSSEVELWSWDAFVAVNLARFLKNVSQYSDPLPGLSTAVPGPPCWRYSQRAAAQPLATATAATS